MFQALLCSWKEFSVSFTLFDSMHVFFKYIIDKKRRQGRIHCCYLNKTINVFIQFLNFLLYLKAYQVYYQLCLKDN